MLKYGNKEFRNLEEQVRQNKEDIARHYNMDRVLADFGIRVIGQVATDAELPDPATYEGTYGDAYAVGVEPPYSFHIWTRADVNAGHPEDYWFDIGDLAIVGPQGPQGIQGEKGDKGDKGIGWIFFTGINAETPPSESAENGTLALNLTTGTVFVRQNGAWSRANSIMGPQGPQGVQGPRGLQGEQGPQGDQGPRGDVGGIVAIKGVVSMPEQLQSPASLQNLTAAFLVGTSQPYDLYVQVGATPETAMWLNTGPMNAATLVYVNGLAQNTWDANTKVDKITGQNNFVYGRHGIGDPEVSAIPWTYNAEKLTIPYRGINGTFTITEAANDNEPVTLAQMTREINAKAFPVYAHRISIKPKSGELTGSGETLTSFYFQTTIYNNTSTPFTLDEAFYGTGNFSNLINAQAWTGEFNRASYTSGNKLCKIMGWRRGSAASGYPLQFVSYRWSSPSDMFTLSYKPEQLELTDSVYSYDT